MKSTKQIPNFKELQRKAAHVALSTEELLNEIDTLRYELPEIEMYSDNLKTINIIDYLNNVETTLYSRIDGRPEPLFINEHIWGLCCEPGYGDKALIKSESFDTEELISLRDWLNKVIAFHAKNTKREPLSQRRKKQLNPTPKKGKRIV